LKFSGVGKEKLNSLEGRKKRKIIDGGREALTGPLLIVSGGHWGVPKGVFKEHGHSRPDEEKRRLEKRPNPISPGVKKKKGSKAKREKNYTKR